jgi:glycosyltransferase involved in cell wall biosynthesis
MSTPTVSIIIPSYRHAAYLQERFDCLINQSFRDWKMLVIDDHSPDDSMERIRELAVDPRIEIREHTKNQGLNATINEGLEWAQGEYVHIAESDDAIDSSLLERLVGLLEGRPHVGLAHAALEVVDEQSERMWLYRDRLPDDVRAHLAKDYVASGQDEFRRLVVGVNHIGNCSGVLFRRSCFEKYGGRDERFRQTAEWHMWMRYCLGWDVAYCAEPLVKWRRHEASVRREISRLEKEHNYYATMRDCLRTAPLPATERRALWVRGRNSRRVYARDVWNAAHDSGKSAAALQLAVQYDPALLAKFAFMALRSPRRGKDAA